MKKQEKIAGILLISLGILILLSLIHFNPEEPIPGQANKVSHRMGFVGFWISFFLIKKTIGYAAYIFPILTILWGLKLVFNIQHDLKRLIRISLYFVLIFFYISILIAIILLPKELPPEKMIEMCDMQPWGLIGGLANIILYQYFGETGSVIVFFTIVVITILYISDINFSELVLPVRQRFKGITKIISQKLDSIKKSITSWVHPGQSFSEADIIYKEETLNSPPKSPVEKLPEEEIIDKEIYEEKDKDESDYFWQEEKDEQQGAGEYILPSTSILDEPPEKEAEVSWDEFMMSAKTLEEKLADFGIQGKVVEINPGPIITRYEIEPAPGIKVNRFTSLADDLALVMRAKRIRVVAPIPGKAAIGIEIPNRKPDIVYMKEVIDSPQFKKTKSVLTIALGKTIAGDIFVTDLVAMPHLLIAGATGSGKSVCLHNIITSILFKSHPAQVQLVMIDPKRLELTPYSALKNHHLAYREDLSEEVVTNASNAVLVLRSLEREMERRYEQLAQAGVRNIEDYNNTVRGVTWDKTEAYGNSERLPYIVLIIDELADLMLTAAREVEEPIARLTQMSRAVGIHLIVATQRPSVDVITGVIKANFPARLAFQVTTKTDSRTILDMNGAEKLLGKGDMLFLPPGTPEPRRIHNAFISHEEVKRIIEYVKKQPAPIHKTKLITEEEMNAMGGDSQFGEERDELFDEALKIVVRHQQGSSSLLQRRLKIGYTRAARIIDQLELAGFVGPADSSKAREVLIDEEELREMGIV